MADQSTSQPRKKLYIETVGCQMNVLDSELVVARLREQGYELTTEIDQADTILYNTCSVRQHAEDKIYSALGRIKHIKRRRPEVSIGVLGCMAQKDQEQILSALRMWTWSSGQVNLHECPSFFLVPGKSGRRSSPSASTATPDREQRSRPASRAMTPTANRRCDPARFRRSSG